MEDLNDVVTDGTASEYWDTVRDFASDITRAAKHALSNRRTHFQRVVAVIVYWESSTGLQHLRNQADELAELFEDRFLYETKIYAIPDNVTDRKFVATIGDELDKVSGDPDSLFILYYGGHAVMRDPTFDRRYWTKENNPRSPEIEWSSAIRSLFKSKVVCSKLFIFDCCHAGGMIDQTLPWETTCELLGACAADVQASALKVSSFTSAVCQEITNNTYNIWELHSVLCGTEKRERVYNLSKFPFYQDFMGHSKQSTSTVISKVGHLDDSEIRPQTPSDRLARLTDISDAVICIAVTFKCSAEVFMEELEAVKKNWMKWFEFAPTDCDEILVKACRGTELIAVFNSSSCVTIWSLPVWLWDAMSPLGGYQRIGIIRPQNFARSVMSKRPELRRLELAIPEPTSSVVPTDVKTISKVPSFGLIGQLGYRNKLRRWYEYAFECAEAQPKPVLEYMETTRYISSALRLWKHESNRDSRRTSEIEIH